MKPEISIAPTPELIRYLCLFHRVFVAMQGYVQDQDDDGVVLMAWIADALHNIPDMLWQYDSSRNWGPAHLAQWVKTFPPIVRKYEAPDRIIAACESIFSSEGASAELALAEDLSDLDLAPPEQIAAHVDLYYRACLSIRWRQARGWRLQNDSWEVRRIATTETMGKMAIVLVQSPIGLVHWQQFDQQRFAQEVGSIWSEWPDNWGLARLMNRYNNQTKPTG